MNEPRRSVKWAVIVAALATIPTACSSVEFIDRDGTPRVVGLGWVRQVTDGDARLYRVSAPGIALRCYPEGPGVSVGFRRTLLFFPSRSTNETQVASPVAIQHEAYGVDVTPWSFLVGYGREFSIPGSLAGDVVQEIDYSERDESHTVVHRREHP